MTLYKSILALLFVSLVVSFSACTHKPHFQFSAINLDTTINPIKLSITDLSKKYKSLHGQYVETEGIFHQGFEEFAIYPKKLFPSKNTKGFWLELDSGFNIENIFLEKMQGGKIKIKGKIDTFDTGHLGQYLATIRQIYFLEQ